VCMGCCLFFHIVSLKIVKTLHKHKDEPENVDVRSKDEGEGGVQHEALVFSW
jgi:hypothetical protein